jgi:hypothetical protein
MDTANSRKPIALSLTPSFSGVYERMMATTNCFNSFDPQSLFGKKFR